MKKKKKKEEATASSASSGKTASKSEGQQVREKTTSNYKSIHGDEDTDNDAASIGSATDSHPASPIPHEVLLLNREQYLQG